MKTKNKFLIFASPRTGSSSLIDMIGSLYLDQQTILDTHIGEPFNPKTMNVWHKDVVDMFPSEVRQRYEEEWDKSDLTRTQMIKVLDVCYNDSFGVKHLLSHLPTYKNFSLLEYVMTKSYKIIVLTRDSNALKDISIELSRQCGAWSKQAYDEMNRYRSIEPDPIDIEVLRNRIDWNINDKARYTDFMCDYDAYHASYEQIFCENNQRSELYKIMDYLEIDREELDMYKFDQYMDYDSNKQNTSEVYSKIPNIDEVIQFAKDEYEEDISHIVFR